MRSAKGKKRGKNTEKKKKQISSIYLGSGPKVRRLFVYLSFCSFIISLLQSGPPDFKSALSSLKSGLYGIKSVLSGLYSALLSVLPPDSKLALSGHKSDLAAH